MDDFQACADFETSLEEVRYLLDLARSGKAGHSGHPALLKSSILLLTAKAENFFESVIEEARFVIERSAVSAADLPPELVIAALQCIIDESFLTLLRTGNQKAIDRLRGFAPALTGNAMTSLQIDTRFSYGKHGEGEIRKLFSRLGIKDVFAVLPASGDNDSDFSASIRADLNSLTAIRNNIIHNDASPAFTVEQVDGFIDRFVEFAHGVEAVLLLHCQKLCAARGVVP